MRLFLRLDILPPFSSFLQSKLGKKEGFFMQSSLLMLSPSDIVPNPNQPREMFDDDSLKELAESIRCHGILQPLTVRSTESGWELIAGERRLRAAQMAGLQEVPCLERQADDTDSALLALVENLQRQDLNFFEEAAAISGYICAAEITQEEAARQLGRSPSSLANKLRLLRLSSSCRTYLLSHGLTERHARALLRLEDEEARMDALAHIAARELNVAQAEEYIDRLLALEQTTPPQKRRMVIVKDIRLFLGSLDRGLRLIQEAGIPAQAQRQDTDDEILLTIRIPKSRQNPVA